MEKIVVSIRVRPLSKLEASRGSPWRVSSNSISLCNAVSGAVHPGQSFVFDSVFGADKKTLDLYEAHVKAIIASAVKGFNGTVFAYGQTSSGKTFTMRGTSLERGIIPLSVQDVFDNILQAEDREFLLRVSYMEIYNEEINDLLAPENMKLQVHESLERGIFVAGLREEIVSCPEQVLKLLEFGEAHRHIGETNMNVYSSRSHTLFRMVIESRDNTQVEHSTSCDAVRVSVLNLVDLAGSERVAKSGAEGARLREGSHINKSLMTLGTVINKLSDGVGGQGGHVPYRDSKLTRILQPALGGNARTVIICNITPALVHLDETKGTLQFASRANRVTNCAQVNEIVTDAALLKRQKREIEELRDKLRGSHSEHLKAEVLNLRNEMLQIELERERMALELQDKAARERRMKEQIENLSSMVLNSAVDERNCEKPIRKSNRRETWCPRVNSSKPLLEVQSLKTRGIVTNRRRNLALPPPFESLKEEDDEQMEDFADEIFTENHHGSNTSTPAKERHVNELSTHPCSSTEEDLQARYDGLLCDYAAAKSEIERLRDENEQLKTANSGHPLPSSSVEFQRLLISNTKLQVAFDAMAARAEVYEMRLEDARWDLIELRDKAKRVKDTLEATLSAARLEIAELRMELESDDVKPEREKLEIAEKENSCGRLKQFQTKLKETPESERKARENDFGTPCFKPTRNNCEYNILRSPFSPLDNLQYEDYIN